MKILMVTNTYAPHVGGVAKSVISFCEEYRQRGHQVLVVAPTFKGAEEVETDVVRIDAIENFNGSDFSVVLPPRLRLGRVLDAFRPDVIHSHHPFLLGATAARLARSRGVPLVFTHHTLYERYTHYLPGNSATMKRLAVRLSTRYARQSSAVLAPSQSVADILRQRQVRVPIFVVPTGVRLEEFRDGDGGAFRSGHDLPPDATVIGHVGRLAEEKNLPFLAGGLAAFLASTPSAYAVFVGEGPCRETMLATFRRAGVDRRVRFAGTLTGETLVDAYHAMNVFAFSSLSETQGMVLAEAMAAGVPVVALDAPSVREIVQDGVNGRLVATADENCFVDALRWTLDRPAGEARALRTAARATAESYSLQSSAALSLTAYRQLIAANATSTNGRFRGGGGHGLLARTRRLVESGVGFASGMALMRYWHRTRGSGL